MYIYIYIYPRRRLQGQKNLNERSSKQMQSCSTFYNLESSSSMHLFIYIYIHKIVMHLCRNRCPKMKPHDVFKTQINLAFNIYIYIYMNRYKEGREYIYIHISTLSRRQRWPQRLLSVFVAGDIINIVCIMHIIFVIII